MPERITNTPSRENRIGWGQGLAVTTIPIFPSIATAVESIVGPGGGRDDLPEISGKLEDL
jgi:hypothetical protein